jgi:hypothetical protein
VSTEEQTLLDALTVLSERMKWVIRIGGALVCILMAGYAYQVDVNSAYGKLIESNTARLATHVEQSDQLHTIIIEKFIEDHK